MTEFEKTPITTDPIDGPFWSGEVMFREVTGALPAFPNTFRRRPFDDKLAYSENAKWFYVELHVGNHGTYGPVGLATVSVKGSCVQVLSLFVLDHMREQGYGRKLMLAIRERWPNASWYSTGKSRPFHQKLVAEGVAKTTGNSYYCFVEEATKAK